MCLRDNSFLNVTQESTLVLEGVPLPATGWHVLLLPAGLLAGGDARDQVADVPQNVMGFWLCPLVERSLLNLGIRVCRLTGAKLGDCEHRFSKEVTGDNAKWVCFVFVFFLSESHDLWDLSTPARLNLGHSNESPDSKLLDDQETSTSHLKSTPQFPICALPLPLALFTCFSTAAPEAEVTVIDSTGCQAPDWDWART